MKPSILIIGGGFAGIEAALTLGGEVRTRAEITLIDRSGSHVFIPSIHEILSGKVSRESISIPLEALCAPAGVTLVTDEVRSVDTVRRRVETSGGTFGYAYLLLATGAENSFFNVPHAEERALRFRTLADAEQIRKGLLNVISDAGARRTIVLAGGGTEGVEVAGEIVDTIEQEGADDDLRDGVLTVVLVEGSPTLLPGFPAAAQAYAREQLATRGIDVRTRTRVREARKGSVLLETGEELLASLFIWTGGIQPAALIRNLDLPKDPTGWLQVSATLRSIGDERVFAAGDAVSILGEGGPMPAARLAYHAMDQGRVAATNIARQLKSKPLQQYRLRERQQLVSIGKRGGILVTGGTVRTGSWVVDLKKAVERKYLLASLLRAGKELVMGKLAW